MDILQISLSLSLSLSHFVASGFFPSDYRNCPIRFTECVLFILNSDCPVPPFRRVHLSIFQSTLVALPKKSYGKRKRTNRTEHQRNDGMNDFTIPHLNVHSFCRCGTRLGEGGWSAVFYDQATNRATSRRSQRHRKDDGTVSAITEGKKTSVQITDGIYPF